MEDIPKTDLDHEFKISVFDYMVDQALAGTLSYAEAMEAYHQVMDDLGTQDNA